MRPPSLLHQTWTSLSLTLAYLLSNISLPILQILLLHHLSFFYPLSLLLIQHLSITLSLLFWALFGLYHPLVPPLRPALLYALATLPITLFPLLTLAHASLALTLSARLLALPLLSFLINKSKHTFLATLSAAAGFVIFATQETSPSPLPYLLSLLTTFSLVTNRLLTPHLLSQLPGSELQLQLSLHPLLTLFLLLLTPLLDDYFPISPSSILAYPWDQGSTVLVLSTGLLAFFAFISRRSAATALHPTAFAATHQLLNFALFAAHFLIFDNRFDFLRALAVTALLVPAATVGNYHAECLWRKEIARRRADDVEMLIHQDLRSSHAESRQRVLRHASLTDPSSVRDDEFTASR